MVWGPECITSVEKGKNTQVETLMVDGQPDLDNAVVLGVVVDFNRPCGHIEIRKEAQ